MIRTAHSVGALVLLATAPATAQKTSVAETLFTEARKLTRAGDHAAACPKYAESQRLDPASGTLLNLADCYERIGRTASAWARYKELLPLAMNEAAQDRAAIARKKIAELEPRLAYVTITVTKPLPGMRVSLGAVELGRAVWGTAVPVDPGTHEITARADGYEPVTVAVTITEAGQHEPVAIEALQPITATAETPPPVDTTPEPTPQLYPQPTPAPRPQPEPDTSPPTVGYVVGSVGIAGLLVGGFFGIRALNLRSDSDTECPNERCTERGASLNDDAITAATISDIGMAIGLLGVGIGAYLILSSGSSGETSVGVGPSRSGASARLKLTF